MSLLVVALHKENAPGLRNLLASLTRHVAAPVVIMDGGSTGPDARAVLDERRRGVEVVSYVPRSQTPPGSDWVFDAMSQAMEIALRRAVDMVLFITASMQVVRSVTAADLAVARAGFARPDASCVIDTRFMTKDPDTQRDAMRVQHVLPGLYARDLMFGRLEPGAFSSFSHVGLVSAPLFRAQLGHFRTSALANEQHLAWLEKSLGVFVAPLMQACPLPSTSSAADAPGQPQWQTRLADRLAGAGLHPIQSLEGAPLERLMDRDPHDLPFAEHFLTAPTLPDVAYWSDAPGWRNLRARGGIWRHAARLLR